MKTTEATAKQIESGLKTAAQQLEHVTALSKGNVEAMVQSSTIMAKGCEEISRNIWSWMQNSVAQSLLTGKQALTVKTLHELFDLQTNFVRQVMDLCMNETIKITEISTQLPSQALAPINHRASEFFEKVPTVKAA